MLIVAGAALLIFAGKYLPEQPPSRRSPADAPATPEAEAEAPAPPPDEFPLGSRARIGSDLEKIGSVQEVEVYGSEVSISLSLNTNVTDSMTKSAVRHAVARVIRVAVESEYPFTRLSITATLPLTDRLGNENRQQVVRANWSSTTTDRINWSRFLPADVFDVADDAWLHPAIH